MLTILTESDDLCYIHFLQFWISASFRRCSPRTALSKQSINIEHKHRFEININYNDDIYLKSVTKSSVIKFIFLWGSKESIEETFMSKTEQCFEEETYYG